MQLPNLNLLHPPTPLLPTRSSSSSSSFVSFFFFLSLIFFCSSFWCDFQVRVTNTYECTLACAAEGNKYAVFDDGMIHNGSNTEFTACYCCGYVLTLFFFGSYFFPHSPPVSFYLFIFTIALNCAHVPHRPWLIAGVTAPLRTPLDRAALFREKGLLLGVAASSPNLTSSTLRMTSPPLSRKPRFYCCNPAWAYQDAVEQLGCEAAEKPHLSTGGKRAIRAVLVILILSTAAVFSTYLFKCGPFGAHTAPQWHVLQTSVREMRYGTNGNAISA